MRAVEGVNGDIHGELSACVLVPVHVHDALWVRFGEVLQVGAVGAVDVHPPPLADKAGDGNRRHRLAAGGEVHQEVVHAGDVDVLPALFARCLDRDAGKAFVQRRLFGVFLLAQGEFVDDAQDADVAKADAGVEVGRAVGVVVLGEFVQQFVVKRDAKAAAFALQHFLSGLDAFFFFEFFEVAAHFGFGARALQVAEVVVQPVAAGVGFFLGEDFDTVAVFQRGGERDDLAVYFGAAAAVAELGVDVVGKVQRRRAFGQVNHAPLRRDGVNAVAEGFVFELVEDDVAAVVVAAFDHAPQPLDLLFELFAVAHAFFFVEPVRGDAKLGVFVHFAGADLYFDDAVFRADERGVQRLVAVGFGVGDVVVEFFGDGLPQFVHD